MAHLLQGLVLLAVTINHKELLRTKTPCVTCHANIPSSKAIAKKERPVQLVNFPHELHLKLGKTCDSCHRGLEESTALTKANYPKMAECIVCHNKIELPFSCEKCHNDPPAQLKTADHSEGFIDRHSRPAVSKEGCAACHGKRFTCLGCH